MPQQQTKRLSSDKTLRELEILHAIGLFKPRWLIIPEYEKIIREEIRGTSCCNNFQFYQVIAKLQEMTKNLRIDYNPKLYSESSKSVFHSLW